MVRLFSPTRRAPCPHPRLHPRSKFLRSQSPRCQCQGRCGERVSSVYLAPPDAYECGSVAPYPQFDAGDRLTNTSELLEMIIIKLSSETILFTQRTSRQFRAVIVNSSLLQRRLFFTTSSTTSTGANIILNLIKGCISDLQPAESRCLQI